MLDYRVEVFIQQTNLIQFRRGHLEVGVWEGHGDVKVWGKENREVYR